MFRRHNSHSFETVLEECLDRIATGDSTDACIEDYPDHAESLQPVLDVAARMRALPSQRLSSTADSAIHQQIEGELRNPAVSSPKKRPSYQRKYQPNRWLEVLTLMRRSFVPLGAVIAMALFSFAMYLQFAPGGNDFGIGRNMPSSDENGGTVQTRVIHTTIGSGSWTEDTSFVLKTELPDSPTRMDVYYADPFNIATTDEAKQFAEQMNIPDPESYVHLGDDYVNDHYWHIIGSDRQVLTIYSYHNNSWEENESTIQYSRNWHTYTLEPQSDPVPFDEAVKIAEQFFSEHDLLPTEYTILSDKKENHWPWTPEAYQNVLITSIVNGLPLYHGGHFNYFDGDALMAQVNPEGDVVYAYIVNTNSSSLGEEVSLISSETAFNLLNQLGQHIVFKQEEANIEKVIHPHPNKNKNGNGYEVGDVIVQTGSIGIYQSADSEKLMASLYAPERSVFLVEDDETLRTIASDIDSADLYTITATVRGKNENGLYEIALNDWELSVAHGSSSPWTCISGTVLEPGIDGQLQIDPDSTTAYIHKQIETIGLKNLPDELNADDYIEVCMLEKIVDGKFHEWSSITIPKVPAKIDMSGGTSSSMRKLVLAEADGETSQHIISEPRYELGESVMIEGVLQANTFTVNGKAQLEFALLDTLAYPYDVYSIPLQVGQEEPLAQQLAKSGGLYVRLTGNVVENHIHYKTVTSIDGLALIVDSYEVIEPERTQTYFGNYETIEINGNKYALFTERETGDQFVMMVSWDLLRKGRIINNVLLTAFADPEQKVGDYPALIVSDVQWKPEQRTAESASEFPPFEPGVTLVEESDLPDQTFVIDSVMLQYMRDNRSDTSQLRPVWVFSGIIEETGLGMEYVVDAAKYED